MHLGTQHYCTTPQTWHGGTPQTWYFRCLPNNIRAINTTALHRRRGMSEHHKTRKHNRYLVAVHVTRAQTETKRLHGHTQGEKKSDDRTYLYGTTQCLHLPINYKRTKPTFSEKGVGGRGGSPYNLSHFAKSACSRPNINLLIGDQD